MERLVRGQEVNGSNPFAPTIISPLNSKLYAAFSSVTSGPDLGTTGTTEGFFVENAKPNLLCESQRWEDRGLSSFIRVAQNPVGPPEMPEVARSFRKIAFFGPDAVVLRSLYQEFNFAPLSVIRAQGWPVADHV